MLLVIVGVLAVLAIGRLWFITHFHITNPSYCTTAKDCVIRGFCERSIESVNREYAALQDFRQDFSKRVDSITSFFDSFFGMEQFSGPYSPCFYYQFVDAACVENRCIAKLKTLNPNDKGEYILYSVVNETEINFPLKNKEKMILLLLVNKVDHDVEFTNHVTRCGVVGKDELVLDYTSNICTLPDQGTVKISIKETMVVDANDTAIYPLKIKTENVHEPGEYYVDFEVSAQDEKTGFVHNKTHRINITIT